MKLALCFGLVAMTLALAPTARAAPAVTITQPTAGVLVRDSLTPITVTVSSTYVVTGVTAQVESVTSNLTYNSPTWNGSLDLSSLAGGPKTLVVTATDASNATGSASIAFIQDRPPVLKILTQDGIFGTSVRLQATCTDPDVYDCASLVAEYNGTTITSPDGHTLDQTVSFGTFDGSVGIGFTAKDSQGLETIGAISVFYTTDPRFTFLARAGGPIRDFDDARLLFSNNGQMLIRPRAGGPDVVVANTTPVTIYLTSHGAIWPGGEWRDGVSLTNAATSNLVAAGDYAGWTSIPEQGPTTVYWRDIPNDNTVLIASGGFLAQNPSIAANGDLTFGWIAPNALSQQVFRYRGSAVSRVSTVSCEARDCEQPVTDGINVVYRGGPQEDSHDRVGTYMTLASGDVITLEPRSTVLGATFMNPMYAVNGGWTAFTKMITAKSILHTRAPDGTIGMVGILNANYQLGQLTDNGDVLYYLEGDPTTYLGRAGGGAPMTLPAYGGITYRAGAWYYVMGEALLRYDGPTPAGDAGAGGGPKDGGAVGDGSTGSDGGADSSTTSDAGADGRPNSDGGTDSSPSDDVTEDGASPADVGADARDAGGSADTSSEPVLDASVDASSGDRSMNDIAQDRADSASADTSTPRDGSQRPDGIGTGDASEEGTTPPDGSSGCSGGGGCAVSRRSRYAEPGAAVSFFLGMLCAARRRGSKSRSIVARRTRDDDHRLRQGRQNTQ